MDFTAAVGTNLLEAQVHRLLNLFQLLPIAMRLASRKTRADQLPFRSPVSGIEPHNSFQIWFRWLPGIRTSRERSQSRLRAFPSFLPPKVPGGILLSHRSAFKGDWRKTILSAFICFHFDGIVGAQGRSLLKRGILCPRASKFSQTSQETLRVLQIQSRLLLLTAPPSRRIFPVRRRPRGQLSIYALYPLPGGHPGRRIL